MRLMLFICFIRGSIVILEQDIKTTTQDLEVRCKNILIML